MGLQWSSCSAVVSLGVAGFAKFIRNDRAESIVYGLSEARVSSGTCRHLVFQCAAARACGAARLLTPYIFPSVARSSFLEKKRSVIEDLVSRSGRSDVLVADPELDKNRLVFLPSLGGSLVSVVVRRAEDTNLRDCMSVPRGPGVRAEPEVTL